MRILLGVGWPILVVLMLATQPLAAQDDPPEKEEEESLDRTFEEELRGDLRTDDIEEILRGDEESTNFDGGYAYDAAGRRDPFTSLLTVSDRPDLGGPRPEGVPGMLIDEITLIGVVKTGEVYIAQVQVAKNQKSYLIREGDQLFDGAVVTINGNEVVFKQIVQDPTAIKPFRERVKALNP